MQPVILAAVCIGELGRGWLRQSAIVVVATVGAFAAALVLVPAPILAIGEVRAGILRRANADGPSG